MTDTETCFCGHVADEHEETKMGYGACTIDGCDCICYESAGDDEDDAND